MWRGAADLMDSQLGAASTSIMQLLIALGTDTGERRVNPAPIVERLDVVQEISTRFLAGRAYVSWQTHSLFGVPKKLSFGAVSYAALAPFILTAMRNPHAFSDTSRLCTGFLDPNDEPGRR